METPPPGEGVPEGVRPRIKPSVQQRPRKSEKLSALLVGEASMAG
jgi:hypothetical protein